MAYDKAKRTRQPATYRALHLLTEAKGTVRGSIYATLSDRGMAEVASRGDQVRISESMVVGLVESVPPQMVIVDETTEREVAFTPLVFDRLVTAMAYFRPFMLSNGTEEVKNG